MTTWVKALVSAVVAAVVMTWLAPGEPELHDVVRRAAIMVPAMWAAYSVQRLVGGTCGLRR